MKIFLLLNPTLSTQTFNMCLVAHATYLTHFQCTIFMHFDKGSNKKTFQKKTDSEYIFKNITIFENDTNLKSK